MKNILDGISDRAKTGELEDIEIKKIHDEVYRKKTGKNGQSISELWDNFKKTNIIGIPE